MKKRTVVSACVMSFMLVFAGAVAQAQVALTVEGLDGGKAVYPLDQGHGLHGSDEFAWPRSTLAYSFRKAIMGSTSVARRAGRYEAATAMISKNTDTAANVIQSLAFTP